MNFPEIPLDRGLLYCVRGNPEFPGIDWHFPGEGFWGGGPQIAISGEDEADMLIPRFCRADLGSIF